MSQQLASGVGAVTLSSLHAPDNRHFRQSADTLAHVLTQHHSNAVVLSSQREQPKTHQQKQNRLASLVDLQFKSKTSISFLFFI